MHALLYFCMTKSHWESGAVGHTPVHFQHGCIPDQRFNGHIKTAEQRTIIQQYVL